MEKFSVRIPKEPVKIDDDLIDCLSVWFAIAAIIWLPVIINAFLKIK